MVVVLSTFVLIGSGAEAQRIPKVLMIPREGKSTNLDLMLSKEVGVMTEKLQKAGFKVVVARASAQPLEGVVHKLNFDLKLADVNIDHYVGVILPCMAVGFFPGPPVSPEAVSIVKQAVAKRKPVAAPAGSVYVLAEAGILKGKRYAFVDDQSNPRPPNPKDPRFEGAIYGGPGVVQDGYIITSAVCPNIESRVGMRDCTSEITKAFIAMLSKNRK